MGEVYRARDCTLERDVAIKILPERWLLDQERRAHRRADRRRIGGAHEQSMGRASRSAQEPAVATASSHLTGSGSPTAPEG
jgi:hypothetical protein